MAEKTVTTSNTSEIQQTALNIFTHRPALMNQSPEQRAAKAFEDAQAFHAVAAKVATGELQPGAKSEEDVLSDASAPNLKRNHPINMVSKALGSVQGREELIGRLKDPVTHGVTLDHDDPGYNRGYLIAITGVDPKDLPALAASN